MVEVAASTGVYACLMHIQGTPKAMQENPAYNDLFAEICHYFEKSIKLATNAGVKKENIILDPGIGFGKRQQDNTMLLGLMGEWRPEEYLLLIGLSRKSFLGSIIDAEAKRSVDYFHQHVRSGDSAGNEPPISGTASRPGDRLTATIAAHAWCLNQGVDILRVHDVKETRQLIAVWEALSWTS